MDGRLGAHRSLWLASRRLSRLRSANCSDSGRSDSLRGRFSWVRDSMQRPGSAACRIGSPADGRVTATLRPVAEKRDALHLCARDLSQEGSGMSMARPAVLAAKPGNSSVPAHSPSPDRGCIL